MTVRILEEKKEKDYPQPATPESKPKDAPKHIRSKPEPPAIIFPKEAESPPLLSPAVAEKGIPEVTQKLEEDRVEAPPQEKPIQEAEPPSLGITTGQEDAEISNLGKGDTSPFLAENSGPVEKGIPGGLSLTGLAGEGAEGKGGGPGGGIEGKKSIPSKGAKTGNVFFHGQREGKGKRDLRSYLGSARLKIEKAKRYPPEARRRGWEGKVILSFQINRNGDVGEILIVQSSRCRELDEEGITTIRRAAPFLPPPLQDQDTLEVRVPLVFKLE